MKKPRSCGFLIVDGNPIQRFLLMKHPNRWDLPKGHVDAGESDLQCALRELEEETGITARDIEVDPDFEYETRYLVSGRRYGLGSKEDQVEKSLRIYLGYLINPVDLVLTEHDGYDWFPWKPPHSIQARSIDPLLAYLERFLA